jgi:hypothetical protein
LSRLIGAALVRDSPGMRRLLFVALLSSCGSPPSPCPCAVAAPARPAPICPSATAVAASSAPLTCGQLTLRQARLVSLGKGDQHPELLAVRARLAECADNTPTAAECAAVREKGIELAKQYGPKHPEMIANEAERAVCAQTM